MLRPSALLVLLVTLLVGCNSLGYDVNQRSKRATNRGYSTQRGYNQRTAERAYPAWARVNDRGRTAYVLCHKDKKTKTVRTSGVRGHLNHGDDFGTCRSDRRARNDRRGYRDQRASRDRDRGKKNDRRHDDDDD